MYVLIEFKESDGGGVAVVSKSWLTPRKQEVFWPPTLEQRQFNKILRGNEEPDVAKWKLYQVYRCFYETDNFEKAQDKLKLSQVISDIQTEDDNDLPKRRKVIPQKLYSSSDEDVDVEEIPRPPRITKIFEDFDKSKSHRLLHHQIEAHTSSNTSIQKLTCSASAPRCTTPLTRELITVNSLTPTPTQSSSNKLNEIGVCPVDTIAFQDKVISLLSYVKEQNSQILAILKGSDRDRLPHDFIQELPVKLPLANQDSLDALEQFIGQQENLDKLIHYLSRLGGRDCSSKVNRILKYVLSDTLATKFNFYGKRSDKKGFCHLILRTAVVVAVASTKYLLRLLLCGCQKTMDVEAEIIKEELQFEESTFCVKTESADEDISIYGVNTKSDVDIESQYQCNKILGNTTKDKAYNIDCKPCIKEESDDKEIWETNIQTKEEEVVLEVKEESRSDELHEDSLSKIKTEELMLKSECGDDDSETGSGTDLEESSDDGEEIGETNIDTKEGKVVFEIKEESSSDDKHQNSLPEIKTEEVMLKSESSDDSSKTGAYWDNCMRDCIINENLTEKSGLDHCEYRNGMISNLDKHKNSINEYNCDQCDYRTKAKVNLKNHIMTKHDKSSIKYGCDQCHYNTHFKSILKRHIMAKHDKNLIKKYECDQCEYRTNMESYLKNHIMAKHNNNSIKYGCNQCDYRTHLKKNLIRHLRAKHDKNSIAKYDCDKCDYRTHFEKILKRHVMAKHDNNSINKYECDQCDYRTHLKKSLIRHIMANHDKNSINKYVCDRCDYRTYRKDMLRDHIMTKHDKNSINKYHCDKCHYKTNFKSCLKRHIMAKHDNSSINKYNCDQCDYRTNMKSYLRNHIMAKHDKNSIKYGCDQCNYKTNVNINLKNHIMAKHDKNSINKYDCDQCDYRTHMKINLKKHTMTKHNKNSINKYDCDQCDYRTHMKIDLKNHIMAKHDKNSINKYHCDKCDYKTHFKSCLKRHIMAKHDKNSINKYYCDQCDYRTKMKSYLKNHIMVKHNQNSIKYGCNYKTNVNINLKKHIMAKHDKNSINKYDCDQCD